MLPDFFSGLESAVNFLIIRHGESEGNAAKILQGRGEYPLSETGRSQAAARAEALKASLAGHSPETRAKTLLFSSPLARARETARIIAEKAGIPGPVFLEELIEMDLGIWTGKSWDQVKNDDPSLWAAFMARSWDAIPEAESSAALYARALRVWAALRSAAGENSAENVLLVTHGGLIQWLLKCTFQSRSWFPLFPISNCGLSRLRVQPRPAEKSAYLCWEEIDSPVDGRLSPSRGFPS